jgi:hypothetical protein
LAAEVYRDNKDYSLRWVSRTQNKQTQTSQVLQSPRSPKRERFEEQQCNAKLIMPGIFLDGTLNMTKEKDI